MHKLRAPLSGFIGSILRLVIGIMTSNGTENYESVNDIHERKNNLCKIIGKQTHIIKAEVSNIHLDPNKKTKHIYTNQKESNETCNVVNYVNFFYLDRQR